MSITEKETQGGIIEKLQRLIFVIGSDVKTAMLIFAFFRMYQVENNVQKRQDSIDKRATEDAQFTRKQLEKFNEQEDRRISIRESEIKIQHATDSIR